MPYVTELSCRLTQAALQHPALAGAQPETRCLNGKLYLAVPLATPPRPSCIFSCVQWLAAALVLLANSEKAMPD